MAASTIWGESAGVRRALWEKTPFFVLAAVFSVVAFLVQQKGGAVTSLDVFSPGIRIANTLVSYVCYIGKMIWPHGLAVYYPHPETLPMWQSGGAGLLLMCLSVAVVLRARRHPYLAVGWLWYLGTLVPVIGVVQLGLHAMADRYTYVPLIGLFIIIAWGVPDLVKAWPCPRILLATSAGVLLSGCMICTCLQVRHWKNTIALFTHTVNVATDNWLAHYNLGVSLAEQGKREESIGHYCKTLQIKPGHGKAHNNLGLELAGLGRLEEATGHFLKAVRIRPDDAVAHSNLGFALTLQDIFPGRWRSSQICCRHVTTWGVFCGSKAS